MRYAVVQNAVLVWSVGTNERLVANYLTNVRDGLMHATGAFYDDEEDEDEE